MTTPRVSSTDAIEIYTLTIAYLHHAMFDIAAIARTMHVKEMSRNVFYFWWQERLAVKGDRAAPAVICTYLDEEKMWKVELLTGETMTLVDTGDVWEIVPSREVQQGKGIRKVRSKTYRGSSPLASS